MPGKEEPRSDIRRVRRPKRLDENRFLQRLIQKKQQQADHVLGYEEIISLDGCLDNAAGNPAEELGMVDMKKAGIIHFDDVTSSKWIIPAFSFLLLNQLNDAK